MQKKANQSKRRTQVKDLPKKKKELTKGEQKKVKGAYSPGLAGIPAGPGATVDLYSKPKH